MEHDQLVAEFRAELPWHLRCSEKTAEFSAYHVRQFLSNQARPFPECFDYPRVFAWLQHLAATPPRRRDKKRREASTVNGHLKSLKRFARWAVARGYLALNPIEHLKGLREADRIIVAPTPEVVGRMLAASIDHGSTDEIRARDHAIISALIDVGPRANELAAMDVSDVLDDDGKIREWCILHGKGNKDRAVAINPLLRGALKEYLPQRRAKYGENALWVTRQGERVSYTALRGIVRRICLKANVTVALHDFRRFALTQMWLDGIDQLDGMLLSGHTDAEVYMRYIRGGRTQRALEKHRLHSPLAALHPKG